MSPDLVLTDAYLHVGRPRFGGPDQLLSFMDKFGIVSAVAVHGPRLIDGASFTTIERAAPGRCRFVSVPPPAEMPSDARAAHIAGMIDFGAIGFRLQGSEYRDPALLDAVGIRGGAVFAIDPFGSADAPSILWDWLGNWPEATVVLPHFLKPNLSQLDSPRMIDLIAHPRVYPVISRQSGTSDKPYPYHDLWPWTNRLVELGAGSRLMWASEYPVFFTRAEPLESVRDWFLETGLLDGEADIRGFFGERVRSLFFNRSWRKNPEAEAPSLPPPRDPVPLKEFHLASDVHGRLIDDFVHSAAYLEVTYHDFINSLLRGEQAE